MNLLGNWYMLSEERRKLYVRHTITDLVLGVLAAIVGIFIRYIFPDHYGEYIILILVAAVALVIFRLVRGEAFIFLGREIRQQSAQDSKKNLEELHMFAYDLKKKK